jgi:hypothetical protein
LSGASKESVCIEIQISMENKMKVTVRKTEELKIKLRPGRDGLDCFCIDPALPACGIILSNVMRASRESWTDGSRSAAWYSCKAKPANWP